MQIFTILFLTKERTNILVWFRKSVGTSPPPLSNIAHFLEVLPAKVSQTYCTKMYDSVRFVICMMLS